MSDNSHYYVPDGSKWPIVGSVGLASMLMGYAHTLHGGAPYIMFAGVAIMTYMLFGWFGDVISENQAGTYKTAEDMSFRMGMAWFIFSEVMFFAAFFGALFYVRTLALPWLGDGADNNYWTAQLLWPEFDNVWPLINTPSAGEGFTTPKEAMGPWGLPAINTLLLLTSGLTCTFAHWALKEGNQKKTVMWLWVTVALGLTFVGLQALEYSHAYHELDLQLDSGIYGSTFYMLTGFHGFHVTLGATILLVMAIRAGKGHFSEHNHFAFEAAAWYWHFVDVVWLGLFIFVYWL